MNIFLLLGLVACAASAKLPNVRQGNGYSYPVPAGGSPFSIIQTPGPPGTQQVEDADHESASHGTHTVSNGRRPKKPGAMTAQQDAGLSASDADAYNNQDLSHNLATSALKGPHMGQIPARPDTGTVQHVQDSTFPNNGYTYEGPSGNGVEFQHVGDVAGATATQLQTGSFTSSQSLPSGSRPKKPDPSLHKQPAHPSLAVNGYNYDSTVDEDNILHLEEAGAPGVLTTKVGASSQALAGNGRPIRPSVASTASSSQTQINGLHSKLASSAQTAQHEGIHSTQGQAVTDELSETSAQSVSSTTLTGSQVNKPRKPISERPLGASSGALKGRPTGGSLSSSSASSGLETPSKGGQSSLDASVDGFSEQSADSESETTASEGAHLNGFAVEQKEPESFDSDPTVIEDGQEEGSDSNVLGQEFPQVLTREEELQRLANAIAGEGIPETDYPILSAIPDTDFTCDDQTVSGYYADTSEEARCQVFHICQIRESGFARKDSFLCPNGTIFNQKYLICDWWFNFDCNTAKEYYSLNEEIALAGALHVEHESSDQTINKPQVEVGADGILLTAPEATPGEFGADSHAQFSQFSQAGQSQQSASPLSRPIVSGGPGAQTGNGATVAGSAVRPSTSTGGHVVAGTSSAQAESADSSAFILPTTNGKFSRPKFPGQVSLQITGETSGDSEAALQQNIPSNSEILGPAQVHEGLVGGVQFQSTSDGDSPVHAPASQYIRPSHSNQFGGQFVRTASASTDHGANFVKRPSTSTASSQHGVHPSSSQGSVQLDRIPAVSASSLTDPATSLSGSRPSTLYGAPAF